MKKILISSGMTFCEDDKLNTLVPIAYSRAVAKAGGIPIIVPAVLNDEVIDNFIDMCDGYLFTGGLDVNPLIYGEDMILETKKFDKLRDDFEIKLLDKVKENKKPVLGICRGMQLINAYFGGTLYQDLKLAGFNMNHHNPQNILDGTHYVNNEEGSIMHNLFGEKLIVNSYHHQAVKKVAPGFKVTSRANDGVVEAMELEGDRYIHLVQFHPEMMVENYPEFVKLFEDFIKRA